MAHHPADCHPPPSAGAPPGANEEPDVAGPDVSPVSRNSSTPETWTMHGVQILDRADGALVASCAQEHWGRQIPASTIYSEGADERTGAQWTHESSSVDASECCSCQRVGLKFQGTHEPAGTKQGDCVAAHAHARWAHVLRLAKAHVDRRSRSPPDVLTRADIACLLRSTEGR